MENEEQGGNILTRKIGPFPGWAYIVIAVGAYLVYKYVLGGGGGGQSSTAQVVGGTTGTGGTTTDMTGQTDYSGQIADLQNQLGSLQYELQTVEASLSVQPSVGVSNAITPPATTIGNQPTEAPTQLFKLPSGDTFYGTPGGNVVPNYAGGGSFFGPLGGVGSPVGPQPATPTVGGTPINKLPFGTTVTFDSATGKPLTATTPGGTPQPVKV